MKTFQSSNGRTYDIRILMENGDNRLLLLIVGGERIMNRSGVRIGFDLTKGTIDWANPNFSDAYLRSQGNWDVFIPQFVPSDLCEYCNKIVKHLILL